MPLVATAVVVAGTVYLITRRPAPNTVENRTGAAAKPVAAVAVPEAVTVSAAVVAPPVAPAPAENPPAAPPAAPPEPASAATVPPPEVLVDPTREFLAQTQQAGPPSPDPSTELDRQVEELIPMPVVKPLMEIVRDWKAVAPNAYPKTVSLKVPLTYRIDGGRKSAGQENLAAGSQVVPVRLDGATLVIAPSAESNIRLSLPVDDTDFKEVVTKRYDHFVEQSRHNVIARRAAEKKRMQKHQTHELELSKYGSGNDPRFDPMKASIRGGGAGFFQIEAAESWRWSGKETVDGVDYETGMVVMVMESAFGTTKRELKALMSNGKVIRWLDAATGKPL